MKRKTLKILIAGLIVALSTHVQAESLHQAVTDHNIESVKLQLQNGADINQLGRSWYEFGSPLHLAVREGHQDIAELLIKNGAEVDVRDHNDYTPLHNAAWNGNLEMVKLLLDAGANITARSYSGSTPLSCAYSSKQAEVIQFIETKLQSASN